MKDTALKGTEFQNKGVFIMSQTTQKPAFMNFTVDHMTLLLHPKLYTVAYPVFRIILGVTLDDLLYEKRRPASAKQKEMSMTFASRIGTWEPKDGDPLSTIIAVVQPSEPKNEHSHVRSMLGEKAAQWQHIALRTPDLIAFHKHCLDHAVQFVTPILRDEHDDLIQVFSGEWFYPGSTPTGMFFEFLQRDPSDAEVQEIQKANKETWFRDKTFLGLYDEKEKEYQSGKVKPFIPEELFEQIFTYIGEKQVWEITENDIHHIQKMMQEFAKKANR